MESSNKKPFIIAAAITASLVVIVFIFSIVSYIGIYQSKNQAEEAWIDVQKAYQQQNELVPEIVDVAARAKMDDKTLLDDVVADKARISRTDINDYSKFVKNDEKFDESLSQLIEAAKKDPVLQDNEKWNGLMTKIENNSERIDKSNSAYNTAAKEYNDKISSFVGKRLADSMDYDTLPVL